MDIEEGRPATLVESFHSIPRHINIGTEVRISDEEGDLIRLVLPGCKVFYWVPKRCVEENAA
jgi:hypothetical protein